MDSFSDDADDERDPSPSFAEKRKEKSCQKHIRRRLCKVPSAMIGSCEEILSA
jgi:hypothetical protein